MGRQRRDRGSAATEVAVMAPLLIVLLVVTTVAGRGVTARMDVDSVADAAARAASLTRDPDAAQQAAVDTAWANLGDGRITCVSLDIDVDTSGFAPGGQVAVTVTCTVQLSDLAGGVAVPGTVTISASAASVVDQWRGTDP